MKAPNFPFWSAILMVLFLAILMAIIFSQHQPASSDTNKVQTLRSFMGITQKTSDDIADVGDLAGKSVTIDLPGLPGGAKKLELVLLVPKKESGIAPFLIGKYEATQGQWKAVMGNNPSDYKNGPDYPVEMVSWNDIKAFCAKVNAMVKQLPGKLRFRLPTDKEWSWAVGLENENGNTPLQKSGKVADMYPWGTQWPPPKGAGNYGKMNDYQDNYENTAPVGSFNPNKYGLYDLGGNVWEWCEDRYDDGWRLNPVRSDRLDSVRLRRVLRGASWFDFHLLSLLSSWRDCNSPNLRYYYVGFRVVLGVSLP